MRKNAAKTGQYIKNLVKHRKYDGNDVKLKQYIDRLNGKTYNGQRYDVRMMTKLIDYYGKKKVILMVLWEYGIVWMIEIKIVQAWL